MGPVLALFIYLLVWWVLLFAVLPMGVRTAGDDAETGHARSAPVDPRLKSKAIVTSVLAAFVVWAMHILTLDGVIRWHEWFDPDRQGGQAFVSAAQAEEPADQDALCRYLSIHKPADDVAYRAGVDVRGKPVVPADLTESVVTPPETWGFDLTVDVAQQAGLDLPEGVEAKAVVGTVTVAEDGGVLFNGKPMAQGAEARLLALCGEE